MKDLVVDRDEGVVGGERPGGTLPVHQQGGLLAIHPVLLHLRMDGRVNGWMKEWMDEQLNDWMKGKIVE